MEELYQDSLHPSIKHPEIDMSQPELESPTSCTVGTLPKSYHGSYAVRNLCSTYCQWFFSTGSVHINPLLSELRVLLSNMDSIETVRVGVYPYISSAPWTGNPLASSSVRHVYSRLNELRPSFLSRFLSCCIHCTFTRLGTLYILR
jgi:hypothetical protein